MSRCQKCGQAPPHLGDSWCISCTSTEALAAELRAGWGQQGGFRAVVGDLLISTVRQVRALRRLSVGAGNSPAPLERAGTDRALPGAAERDQSAAPSHRAPAPPKPPSPPRTSVKEEEGPSEESGEDDSDSEGSGEKTAEEKEVEKSPPATVPKGLPGAFAKSKASREKSSSLPRKRKSPGRERGRGREGKASRRDPEDSSPKRERKPHRREEDRHREKRESKEKHKKTRRAGSRHQRLWRAKERPFQRFHHRQPDSFWDNPPTL